MDNRFPCEHTPWVRKPWTIASRAGLLCAFRHPHEQRTIRLFVGEVDREHEPALTRFHCLEFEAQLLPTILVRFSHLLGRPQPFPDARVCAWDHLRFVITASSDENVVGNATRVTCGVCDPDTGRGLWMHFLIRFRSQALRLVVPDPGRFFDHLQHLASEAIQ